MIKTLKVVAVLGFALAAQSISSQAVTIGFGTAGGNFNPYVEGDFQVSTAQLQNGNCATGACLLLNTNSTSILSLVSGGLFTLNSFWLKTQGQPSVVNVEAFVGNTSAGFISQIVPKNTAQTISLLFADVTSIKFTDAGQGAIRIDDINVTAKVSAVPLPAGLPLLVSGLFGLGLLKRRRDKAQA